MSPFQSPAEDMHDLPVLAALPKDVKQASESLGRDEARFLVDTYYRLQDLRKTHHNQERALDERDAPHATVTHFASQFALLERYVQGALDVYSAAHPLGQWARSQVGIGPVIAAGLLAHIDIGRVNTAGQVWRYAGLDPTSKWEKGQKRPYNADLKVLCWKIGDSFVKLSGREDCFYGKLYRQRKAYEVARNEAVREVAAGVMVQFRDVDNPIGTIAVDGEQLTCYGIAERWLYGGNAKVAYETLRTRNIKDKATLGVYNAGKLPDGRIDLRARRWAVKLFLSHYFEEGYRQMHGEEPPAPYPIAHMGHAHLIKAPVGA